MNGYHLSMPDSELVEFMVELTSTKPARESLKSVLEPHVKQDREPYIFEEARDFVLYYYDSVLRELSHR